MSTWFRVCADYVGKGEHVLVGEAADRIDCLALTARAHKDGAKSIKIYHCENLGGGVAETELFAPEPETKCQLTLDKEDLALVLAITNNAYIQAYNNWVNSLIGENAKTQPPLMVRKLTVLLEMFKDHMREMA